MAGQVRFHEGFMGNFVNDVWLYGLNLGRVEAVEYLETKNLPKFVTPFLLPQLAISLQYAHNGDREEFLKIGSRIEDIPQNQPHVWTVEGLGDKFLVTLWSYVWVGDELRTAFRKFDGVDMYSVGHLRGSHVPYWLVDSEEMIEIEQRLQTRMDTNGFDALIIELHGYQGASNFAAHPFWRAIHDATKNFSPEGDEVLLREALSFWWADKLFWQDMVGFKEEKYALLARQLLPMSILAAKVARRSAELLDATRSSSHERYGVASLLGRDYWAVFHQPRKGGAWSRDFMRNGAALSVIRMNSSAVSYLFRNTRMDTLPEWEEVERLLMCGGGEEVRVQAQGGVGLLGGLRGSDLPLR